MRVLLVQCCHLPQWFYIWEQLEHSHPDWWIEGLATAHPDARYYVRRLTPDRTVYFLGESTPPDAFDLVIFPLCNRGYLKVKRAGRRLRGRKLAVDYQGRVAPLDRVGLWFSVLRPRFRPTPEFIAALESFPHRPLGEKLLVVESCHPSLVERSEPLLAQLFRRQKGVTRIGSAGFRQSWREVREGSFDGSVVYFSGESGYFLLKLIPFLLRIRRIVVVNESGDFFYAGIRSLLAFAWRRLRYGRARPARPPRILLMQTEHPDYLTAAVERLQDERLFPGSEVLLLCRPQDREYLAARCPGLKSAPLPVQHGWKGFWSIRREVNQFNPDFNAGVFTGRPVFRGYKLLLFLLGSRRLFALNAQLDGYWATWRTWVRMLRREPLRFGAEGMSGRTVLLVQTEGVEYTRVAVEKIRDPRLYPEAQVLLWHRPEDGDAFRDLSGVHLVAYARTLGELWHQRRRLARRRPEAVCGVFTGRPVFRRAKLLYWLAPGRRFAFNAHLDGYWVNWRTWRRMLRREPLLFGNEAMTGRPVVLVQTEGVEYTRAAVEKIRDPRLYPAAKVILWHRPEDGEAFGDLAGVDRVPYAKSLGQAWRQRRELARRKPETVFGVFSGRPVFRWAKLLYWLAPGRRRFAFNAQLDGYWVTWRTWRRMGRREPLLFGQVHGIPGKVLLLETEGLEQMVKAVEVLGRPHVAGDAPVVVFCHREREAFYQSLPGVSATISYTKQDLAGDARAVIRALGSWPGAIAAVLSGRPIFKPQKALFWLIPARSRLVFNRELDCFFLDRRTFPLLFQKERQPAYRSVLELVLRPAVKVLLFFPRFAYLAVWACLSRSPARRPGVGPPRESTR